MGIARLHLPASVRAFVLCVRAANGGGRSDTLIRLDLISRYLAVRGELIRYLDFEINGGLPFACRERG
jgi:hypothetical protein